MTKKQGSTHLGRTAMAALARYEEEKNATRQPSAHTPTTHVEQTMPPALPRDPYAFSTRPRAPVKATRRRRAHFAFMPSLRVMIDSLFARKTKPNLSGKKALAAMARFSGKPPVAAASVASRRPHKTGLFAKTKKLLSDFRAQATTFASRHGHTMAQAAFGFACFAIMVTSASAPSHVTASSIADDAANQATVAAQSSLSIAPLVVVDGSMKDGPQDAPTAQPETDTKSAPVISLTGTRKVPFAPAAVMQPSGRVRVTFDAPAYVATSKTANKPTSLTKKSKRAVAKAKPASKSVEHYRAQAIQLFLDARITAGKMTTPENNNKARVMYLRASSAAQRGDFMNNHLVKNGHAELALLYTGVPGVSKSMRNAANIMKHGNPNSVAGQKVMERMQVENPLLFLELQKGIVKDAVDSASTLKRPGRVRMILNPVARTASFP